MDFTEKDFVMVVCDQTKDRFIPRKNKSIDKNLYPFIYVQLLAGACITLSITIHYFVYFKDEKIFILNKKRFILFIYKNQSLLKTY